MPLKTTEFIAELNPVLRGWGHHYTRAHVRKLFHRLDGWIGGPGIPSGFLRVLTMSSALDAVGLARQRCWRHDWIIDLDINGFFDNIPQDLLIRALKKHAQEQWMVLHIERWLTAPVQEEDGSWSPVRRAFRKAVS